MMMDSNAYFDMRVFVHSLWMCSLWWMSSECGKYCIWHCTILCRNILSIKLIVLSSIIPFTLKCTQLYIFVLIYLCELCVRTHFMFRVQSGPKFEGFCLHNVNQKTAEDLRHSTKNIFSDNQNHFIFAYFA